jgi:hypothetical protein
LRKGGKELNLVGVRDMDQSKRFYTDGLERGGR